MDEATRQSTLMSALTTEHFVLQTAVSSTISEASARSSLYVLSLSSSLVAMGFTAQSREVFIPFVASVIPAVFLLGLFTIMRLVDTALESMQYLAGIARIRKYYRTLGPEAAAHFAAETGRWPERKSTPALRLGSLLAFLGTTASMIAVTNNVLAGAGVTLWARALLDKDHAWLALPIGIASAVLLTVAFLVYQRWRFADFDPEKDQTE
jgi:hypothetical protein